MENIPACRTSSGDIDEVLDGAASFADVVFGFPDGGDVNDSHEEFGDDDDDGCDENLHDVEADRTFWETQDQLLQATLYRTSSLETKIRQAAKAALKEINSEGLNCVCRKPVAGRCRNCLQGEVSTRLQSIGFNCFICKSKWKSSPEIPSGEHTYLEILDKSNLKKKEVRVVIELSFRAEFEMARASEDYNRLIARLPKLFVGKAERLNALINILCGAAKKCMKEKGIHLAPWRKHKYVQAKWLGTCEKKSPPAPLPAAYPGRLPKPRVSMLTFDLSGNLTGLRCTAVEV